MNEEHGFLRPLSRRARGLSDADLADIQGNVLRPYDNDHGEFLMVEVADPHAGRRLLADLRPAITPSTPWAAPPASTLNLALSATGLGALGMSAARRADFPTAFDAGAVGRAAQLGDKGPSAAEHWDPGLRDDTGHLLIAITAWTLPALEAAADEVASRVTGDDGLRLAHRQRAFRFADQKEHFGFLDGVAQPRIAGIDPPNTPAMGTPLKTHWRSLPAGEFVLGHRDAEGLRPAPPGIGWGANGSFMVLRKLHQDVDAFRSLIHEAGAGYPGGPELLAAKLIGRWPDGTPLALSPDRPDPAIAGDPGRINDFRFSDDPEGLKCPVGAHIRRANPRDGAGVGGAMTTRHRIMRRGLPYGPRLEPGRPDDGADRGLIFVCFGADIERQFEFLQKRWLNDGDVLGLGHDPDPLLGLPERGDKLKVPGSPPYLLALGRPLITVRGAAYLFQPSLAAIDALAGGRA